MPTVRKPSERLVRFLCLLARRHGTDFVGGLVAESAAAGEDPYLARFCKDKALELTPPHPGRVAAAARARESGRRKL